MRDRARSLRSRERLTRTDVTEKRTNQNGCDKEKVIMSSYLDFTMKTKETQIKIPLLNYKFGFWTSKGIKKGVEVVGGCSN